MPNSPTYKETLLAKDANLARWYNNLKHGSPVSADGGLRRVGRICKLFNTTPAELAQLSVKDATNLLLDLVTKLEENNMQPTYMSHFVKVMKSWFSFNGIHITERIKIPDSTKTRIENTNQGHRFSIKNARTSNRLSDYHDRAMSMGHDA